MVAHRLRQLTGAPLELLVQIVENGPLRETSLAQPARDELIALGMVARCVVKLDDGYLAATYDGRDAYKRAFQGSTIREAHAKRMAQVIERAGRKR
jgi:hypothetical protein